MKIYIDLILMLNFVIDFILLLVVSIVLKRKKNINRIILAAFIGSLTVFLLFIKISKIELFIFKLVISIIMVVISFNYKNLKYTIRNILYLYIVSIILGGFMYYLNITFSYKQEGIIFIFKGLSINVLIIFLISPIILLLYIKQTKQMKENYSNCYKVDIYLKDEIIHCTGFLDTGNKLEDPYLKKPIILVNKEKIKTIDNKILVPYSTINNIGLLECIAVDKIFIENIGYKSNLLIGLIENKIKIDGVDCILHYKLLEEKC